MTKEAKVRVKETALGRFARAALKPVVADGDPGPAASKYGGVPWLREDEAWPCCPSCERPMHLVVQLDLAALPDAVRARFGGKGLVQFFACTSAEPLCEVETEAFFPQSGATEPRAKLVRLVMPEERGGSPASTPQTDAGFGPKGITGWTMVEDFPADLDECEEISGAVDDAMADALRDACEADDKVAGWPKWRQGVEYPSCPACGDAMTNLVCQLPSEGLSGCTFCGDGVAYLCQCPRHPEQLDEIAQR